MPLDFPASPSDGDVYEDWTWNAAASRWDVTGGGGGMPGAVVLTAPLTMDDVGVTVTAEVNTTDLLAPTMGVYIAGAMFTVVSIIDETHVSLLITSNPNLAESVIGPEHGLTVTAFAGAVRIPDGRVVLCPFNSPVVGIYNPATDTYTAGAAHGISGTAGYGATLLPDGKVLFCNNSASNPLIIYDPIGDTCTNGPTPGQYFTGSGSLLPDGRVILASGGGTYIGIYNSNDGTYTNGPSTGGRSFAFTALLPDGRVMCIPYNSPVVGFFTPGPDTYSEGSADITNGVSYAWFGGVLLPDGRVILVPNQSPNVGIYNPVADTFTAGTTYGFDGTTNIQFHGGVLLSDGRVAFAPYSWATKAVGIYNPANDTFEVGPPTDGQTPAFQMGGCALPGPGLNPAAVFSPRMSLTIGVLRFNPPWVIPVDTVVAIGVVTPNKNFIFNGSHAVGQPLQYLITPDGTSSGAVYYNNRSTTQTRLNLAMVNFNGNLMRVMSSYRNSDNSASVYIQDPSPNGFWQFESTTSADTSWYMYTGQWPVGWSIFRANTGAGATNSAGDASVGIYLLNPWNSALLWWNRTGATNIETMSLGSFGSRTVFSAQYNPANTSDPNNSWLFYDFINGWTVFRWDVTKLQFGYGGVTAMTMDTATQGVRAVTIGPGYVPYASQANFTVSSDPRVKDIIGNYKTGLNAIKEMNPIAFRYNGLGDTVRSDDLSYGFDGAEMSRIMPETTRQRPDGYLMLDQGPVLLALVNAVKELAIKVEKLESGK